MRWKSFFAGVAVGSIGGYFVNKTMNENTVVSGEKVLKKVKDAFKKEGPIDGSWINLEEEDYAKYALKTKVYRGGITCQRNGERQQYEFIADAYTGTVIDVYPLSI